MKKFICPKLKIKQESTSDNYGIFIIEPIEQGLGNSIGNALRRTLLSAIPGAAIFGVKIDGVTSEFSPLEGVTENPTQIILNLKNIVLTINDEVFTDQEIVTLNLKATEGIVTAGMIDYPAGVEVLNPELHIATVSKGHKMEITLYAMNSRGYNSFEENKQLITDVNVIAIDSIFSPIIKTNYKIETIQVGKNIDLERLIFNIETTKAISAIKAFSIASKILIAHLQHIEALSQEITDLEVMSKIEEEEDSELNTTIEELELTVRSYNSLKKSNINTVNDLINKTEHEILTTRNLGKKSFLEIKEKVAELGFTFKSE